MSVCLLVGGPALSLYTFRGEVLFEDHEFLGPMPVTKAGAGRTLADSHPFWAAVTEWYRTGKKLDGNKCIVGPTESRP